MIYGTQCKVDTACIAQLVIAPPRMHWVVSLHFVQAILIPKTLNMNEIFYLWQKNSNLLQEKFDSSLHFSKSNRSCLILAFHGALLRNHCKK